MFGLEENLYSTNGWRTARLLLLVIPSQRSQSDLHPSLTSTMLYLWKTLIPGVYRGRIHSASFLVTHKREQSSKVWKSPCLFTMPQLCAPPASACTTAPAPHACCPCIGTAGRSWCRVFFSIVLFGLHVISLEKLEC